MIEIYFERPHALQRVYSACTGPHMDAFAHWLSALGYTQMSGRDLIRGVTHLGQWLDRNGVALAALDESLLDAFAAEIKEASIGNGKPRYCRTGARQFLHWARERSIVSTSASRPESSHPLRRMPPACTGPHMDAFGHWLSALGYTPKRGRELVLGVTHLGQWLDRNGVALAALDESLIEAFTAEVKEASAGAGRMSYCRAGSRRFLNWARERSIVSTSRPEPAVPEFISDFNVWMKRQRNVSEATLYNYGLPLRRLVEALGEDPSRFDAANIRQFILHESQRAGRGYAQTVVKAARMLLRHLALVGRSAPELADAVPTIASWGLASLPTFLQPEEVELLIGACDPGTAPGSRDRAMLLLMARLGLRAGDLVRLRLGDIDWTNASLAVSGKNRRSVRMPLPQDVGDALLHWITKGRCPHPDDDNRVFLRVRVPIGPLTNVGVNNVVVRAARRASVTKPGVGPHMLRHSAATALLNQGASLSTVGAVLRHERIDTTAIYAKVDTGLLASIARPWPEGGSR